MLIYREKNDFNVNRVGDELINQDLRQDIELDFDLEKIQQIEREQKAQEMQLKVIYNKESQTFWVNRKLDPLSKLLKLAIDKFAISTGQHNCRLRAYNIVNGLMQDTYSGQED